jgi:Kef-type K+ transport system membrane component KefB
MELSCFVAGVIVASDEKLSESVMEQTRPLKELFSALFFASLGLHIYPSFLLNEGLLLVLLAASCMFFKVVLTTSVMMTVSSL